MTTQPTLTAKVTHVRRAGFATAPSGDWSETFTDPPEHPVYTVTYWHEDYPHDLTVLDNGKGGFVAKIERAVREDLERRRYLEPRDVHLTLPMEVTL